MNRFLILAKNVLITIKYHRGLKFNFDFLNIAPAIVPLSLLPTSSTSTSINELMLDGMLWGVPKKRRPIERRLKNRFGVENYPQSTRILRPRNDLIICERCGDHHEYFTICPTCYSKVKEETKLIKKAMENQMDPLKPKEKEILLKFDDDETSEKDEEKFQIIKMDRSRPKWFSKNLMTKSTKSNAYNPKDVILDPKDLINDNNKTNS